MQEEVPCNSTASYKLWLLQFLPATAALQLALEQLQNAIIPRALSVCPSEADQAYLYKQ